MKINRFLIVIGSILSVAWLYLFAQPTIRLVQQILEHEPYYVDILSMYMLPYAIAPFFAASYVAGAKQTITRPLSLAQQWFNFAILIFFAFLQLFGSFAFFFAYFETFTTYEPVVEWVLIIVPILFFLLFVFIIRYLLKTRYSLKSQSLAL
jgi:hypothetical protein